MLNNPIDLMRLRVDQNGSLVAPQSLSDAFERHARAILTIYTQSYEATLFTCALRRPASGSRPQASRRARSM